MRVVFGENSEASAFTDLGELARPCQQLLSSYERSMRGTTRLTQQLPKETELDDPIVLNIEQICSQSLATLMKNGTSSTAGAHIAMLELISSHASSKSYELPLLLAAIAKTLKKAYFAAKFSRRIILEEISNVETFGSANEQSGLINRLGRAADWIFADPEKYCITLAKTETICVDLNSLERSVTLTHSGSDYRVSLDKAETLSEHIAKETGQFLVEDGFDYRPGLLRMVALLSQNAQRAS